MCMTDPEEARVTVPDERFDWLCKQYNPEKKTPAFVRSILFMNVSQPFRMLTRSNFISSLS